MKLRAPIQSKSESDASMLSSSPQISIEHIQPAQKRRNRLLRAIPKVRQTANLKTEQTELGNSDEDRGVLAPLLDAPSDIFYEVAARLHPGDLLSLCRVSHQFRDLFLSKRSKEVWIKSFALTDFPPCPQDLNEPQYASLLYETDCMACGEPDSKSIYIELRLRLCKECYDLNVVRDIVVLGEFARLHNTDVSEELYELGETVSMFTPYLESGGYDEQLYYRPDFLDGLEDCLLAYQTNSEVVFQEFIDERLRWRDAVVEHSELMRAWVENLRNNHAESVKSRLRMLGYTDEDLRSDDDGDILTDTRDWESLIYKASELTDEDWEALFPKLVEFISRRRRGIRWSKRRGELTLKYLAYYRAIPLTYGEVDFFPCLEIMLENKVMDDLITRDDFTHPITEAIWAAHFPIVEQICREYKFKALFDHNKAIIEERSKNKRDIDGLGDLEHLTLASSLFAKAYDGLKDSFYFFNSIHSIGMYHPGPFPDYVLQRDFPSPPWTALFSDNPIKTLDLAIPNALLKDMNLPWTTKMSAMQSMGARFACGRCHESFQKVMVWPELVAHFFAEIADDCQSFRYLGTISGGETGSDEFKIMKDHSLEGGSLARLLTDAEIVAVAGMHAATQSLPTVFRCKICPQLGIDRSKPFMTEPQIQAHIRIKHGKEPQPEDRQLDLQLFNHGVHQ